MYKLSIYENNWINLVFEGKNKEYGAYKLRQESDKTICIAFIVGLLLLLCLASISSIINNLNYEKKIPITHQDNLDKIIQISLFHPFAPVKPTKIIVPVSQKKKSESIIKKQFINPEIVKPINATDIITTNVETPFIETNDNAGALNDGNTEESQTSSSESLEKSSKEIIINSTSVLDKLPEFPGGINKFYTYIGTHFEKPEFEVSKTIRIYVSFVIEKDGKMSDIRVIRDPGYGLADEAIRVLKSLKTKWTPGIKDGKAVRTAYNLPIIVEIR